MSVPVCYIVSTINKALAFEWIAEELDKQTCTLHFILLNPGDSALEDFLHSKQVSCQRITYRGKKDLLKAIFQIFQFLKRHRIAVVHCHLFDANVAGLIAARLAGVPKRIYTRHHSTLHHEHFPRAVYYDRFVNSLATDIVAISAMVRQVLIEKESVPAHKIHLIHHGFRLEAFTQVLPERKDAVQKKYNPTGKNPVIGVISRYTEWKGIQYIIPAFEQLLKTYPDALLLLANAHGDYEKPLRALLQRLPAESYVEIPFEADIFALYTLIDVFVHVPVNATLEAFGQTYVEALAAGVPSVFTPSGVAPECMIDKENAIMVPFRDSSAIVEGIHNLLTDDALRKHIQQKGQESVQAFALARMIHQLENLYLQE